MQDQVGLRVGLCIGWASYRLETELVFDLADMASGRYGLTWAPYGPRLK